MNGDAQNGQPIRVLVADDSAFMRTALTRMIESDPALKVVASAMNGSEALEKITSFQPDVITLDIEMPVLNGLEALRRIMRDFPRPVIMVSSLTQQGAEATLEALDIGAFDYIPKQQSFASLGIVKIRDDLVAKIKAAAETNPVRRAKPQPVPIPRPVAEPAAGRRAIPAMVAIGTSTGGPKALQQILPMLPADLPVGILIVQHMPPGFTGPFARRLDRLCKITVREAEHGDRITPGTVLIAPAGQHATVTRPSPSELSIRLSSSPLGALHIPSVDVTMLSVAETCRALSMGIIMTGMGSDGLQGMKAIAHQGGLTLGQDQSSSVVYGMPRSCAEAGILQRVVPLAAIPEQIMLATGYRQRP